MIIETLGDVILYVILAAVLFILGAVLRTNKKNILVLINDLVQQAEAAVLGFGMGEAKKALVLTQLETMGVKLTEWVSNAIDATVEELNRKNAWLIEGVYRSEAVSSDDA